MSTILLYAGIAFWVLALILHWIPDPAPDTRVSTVARLRGSAYALGFIASALSMTVGGV